MFTYIERTARGGPLRHRRQTLFKVPVPGGSPFYVLRAGERVPQDALLGTAARCAPVVLTDLPIPPDAPVQCFAPRLFPLRRAADALFRLLRETALPPQQVTLGICDPHGALRGRVCAFLPFAADVRIVTRDAAAYEADVRTAAREWGAGLTAGEDDALLGRCTVLLGDAGCSGTDAPLRFSVLPGADALSPLPLALPPALEALRPASVDAERFAAALSELCGVPVPDEASADGVLFGARELDTAQAAALWRARFFVDNSATGW